mgnify:CR=1 FL=1
MWRGGCIIRSRFLGEINHAYEQNPELDSLMLTPFFATALNQAEMNWRKAIVFGVQAGIPMPALSAALAFYDGYRTANGSANMIQAQRDYFGAHTYERTDRPRGEWHHTDWVGSGGLAHSTTYEV